VGRTYHNLGLEFPYDGAQEVGMQVPYCTLEEARYQATGGVSARSGVELRDVLAASRRIDELRGHPMLEARTEVFREAGAAVGDAEVAWWSLPAPLQRVISLTADGVAVPGAEQSFRWQRLGLPVTSGLPVVVHGLWGPGELIESAELPEPLGSGSLSVSAQVVSAPRADSLDEVAELPMALSKSGTFLQSSAGSLGLETGEVYTVGTERIRIVSQAVNARTGAVAYVLERGVEGTTAAAHDAGAAISTITRYSYVPGWEVGAAFLIEEEVVVVHEQRADGTWALRRSASDTAHTTRTVTRIEAPAELQSACAGMSKRVSWAVSTATTPPKTRPWAALEQGYEGLIVQVGGRA